MTTEQRDVLVCDGMACEAEFGPAHADDMITDAETAGWVCRTDGMDFCRECVAKGEHH